MKLHIKFYEGTNPDDLRAVHLKAFVMGATSINVVHETRMHTSHLLYQMEGPKNIQEALKGLIHEECVQYVDTPPKSLWERQIDGAMTALNAIGPDKPLRAPAWWNSLWSNNAKNERKPTVHMMQLHLKFEHYSTEEQIQAVHETAYARGAVFIKRLPFFDGEVQDGLYVIEAPEDKEGAMNDLKYADGVEFVAFPPTRETEAARFLLQHFWLLGLFMRAFGLWSQGRSNRSN